MRNWITLLLQWLKVYVLSIEPEKKTVKEPKSAGVKLHIIPKWLPDFCYSSRVLKDPTGITIHYVSAIYAAPAKWDHVDVIFNQTVELNRVGPERGPLLKQDDSPRNYASYHYLIDREGNQYQLTPLRYQAYHAGVSEWKGKQFCNRWAIGIALVAHADSGYTEAQYQALEKLVEYLQGNFEIEEIFGHDECAPGRKQDPGKLFDWSRIRPEGK